MKRNLIDVIDQMIDVIPKNNNHLISQLRDIQDSQKFRAPEDMIGWQNVNEILNKFNFNKHTPEWQLEICSIFSTIPLYQIKNEFKDIE